MNKRKLLNFFLMNQDPAAAGGGAPAAAPAPAPAGGDPAAAPAPAPAGTPAAAPAPAPAPAQTDNSPGAWLQSLPDAEAKAYAENKGWKDPSDAVKAIREMEGKYAVPENADAYQLPVPQGQDGEFAKQAASWMHKAGIPVAQAQALATEWNNAMAAQETARQAQVTQDMSALKTEWGTEFDANVELGRRVMRNFGVQGAEIDRISGQLGDAATLRVFQRIGKGLSEGSLGPSGGGGAGGGQGISEAELAAKWYPNSQHK